CCRKCTRTTWSRWPTGAASRCAAGTTATSRSCASSASNRPRERAFIFTTRRPRSICSSTRSRKSRNFSAVDFEELYQDVILDHSRRPRNYGELPFADFHIHGDNPNCGDEITLHIKFAPGDAIAAASFTG